jgi:hypothetical protein
VTENCKIKKLISKKAKRISRRRRRRMFFGRNFRKGFEVL